MKIERGGLPDGIHIETLGNTSREAAEAIAPIAKDLRSRVPLPPSEALTAASRSQVTQAFAQITQSRRLSLSCSVTRGWACLDGLRQAARGLGSRPNKRALL